MKNYTDEQILQMYINLPKGVKETVFSEETAKIVQKIGEKHNLHVDKIGELNNETGMVMLGAERTIDFIKNIKARLDLPDEKVNAIAKDVNEKIFLPIRESLKKAEDTPPVESPNSFATGQAGIRNQESGVEQKPKEIHHPPLSQKPHGEARSLSESEEIKKQVAQQQTVKPVSTPPPNLPTSASTESSEPKEPNLEARLPSEQKKPTHIDPYREPIE